MINLTPISKKIQTRLFEKMSVLGREQMAINNTVTGPGVLTHDKLATRSTFLRMTSGLANPVILAGGELVGGSNMAAGYEDIYGPRTTQDRMGHERLTQLNKFKRPMPGLKSADISFKGGIRALREATISWTCWSFEDIGRLTPHFLSLGVEVLLEWAWVYDEFSLQNLPTLYDKSRGLGIKRSAYKSYSEIVDVNQGDFDFMVGVVKNFEYTTRADGGFDCQTKITSVGASVLLATTPPKDSINKTTTYKVSKSENLTQTIADITNAQGNPNKLVDFDSNATLKTFIGHMDTYLQNSVVKIRTEVPKTSNTYKKVKRTKLTKNKYLYTKKNSYIIEMEDADKGNHGTISNAWVRWGWFEDNILSKFLSLIAPKGADPFVTKFRSVERTGGGYESVRIMNHIQLQTTDINKFILPGQISPFSGFDYHEENMKQVDKTIKIQNEEVSRARVRMENGEEVPAHMSKLIAEQIADETSVFSGEEQRITIPGDPPQVIIIPPLLDKKTREHALADLVERNEKIEASRKDTIPSPTVPGDPAIIGALKNVTDQGFQPFSTDGTTTTTTSTTAATTTTSGEKFTGTAEQNNKIYKMKPEWNPNKEGGTFQSKPVREKFWNETFGGFVSETTPASTTTKILTKPGYEGYLRNMLINTKLIKEAFGVDDEEGKFTIESVNVKEALENLFFMLNNDIDIWDFKITQDEVETNRSKIVDDQIIAIDLQKKLKINDPIERDPGTKSTYTMGNVINNGVFFFPVWDHRSMVKSQNITSKVPNAMALATMYGVGFDELKTMGASPIEATPKEGAALAGMFKDYHIKNPNVNMDNINIALKQDGYDKVGASGTEPLSKDGGDEDLRAWFNDTSGHGGGSSYLQKTYNEKINKITEQIDVHKRTDFSADTEITLQLGDKSIPFPLPEQMKLYPDIYKQIITTGDEKSDILQGIYSSKYHKDGRMKQQFITSIRSLIHGTGKKNIDTKKPLLIPLDLELTIDGIGGIIPGNSFHSSYLPERYQEETLFQAFDINHTVDGSGWTTAITGKMRTTLEKAIQTKDTYTIRETMEELKKLKIRLDVNAAKKEKLAEENVIMEQSKLDTVQAAAIARTGKESAEKAQYQIDLVNQNWVKNDNPPPSWIKQP